MTVFFYIESTGLGGTSASRGSLEETGTTAITGTWRDKEATWTAVRGRETSPTGWRDC